jgi:hypothetical protein
MDNRKFYFSKGVVRYKNDGWVVIECPYSIVNYYKWWVEKMIGKKISTSYHKPHITVVAAKHEPAKNMDAWKKRDGQVVDFKYYTDVRFDSDWSIQASYFWLVVECPTVADIRTELGLRPNLKFPAHLTIGYRGN